MINRLKLIIPLLFIVVLISSCKSQEKKYYPVKNRDPRVSSLGFSVVPPAGVSWLEKSGNKTICFIKKTDPKIYTFYVGATEIYTKQIFSSSEEFLKFIKNKKDFNEYPNRFKNMKSEFKIDNRFAPFCVTYYQKYEDHEAKNLGENKFLIIENHGLLCLRPESPDIGVDIYYSERYLPKEQNLLLKKEGETFIQSLKFFPIKNK